MAKKKPTSKKKAAKAAGPSKASKTSKKTTKTAKKKATTRKTTTKKRPAVKKTTGKQAATTKKTTKKKKGSGSKPAAKAPAPAKAQTKAQAVQTTAPQTAGPEVHDNGDDEIWTDERLRKVKTGLKKKDLDLFRKELLERRTEIVGDLKGMDLARTESAGDISHVPLHMADVGSDNYDREFTLGLMETDRKLLREIDEALGRLDRGTYGVCAETGRPISRARLEFIPWAKYCIDVARQREKRGL